MGRKLMMGFFSKNTVNPAPTCMNIPAPINEISRLSTRFKASDKDLFQVRN